MAKTIIPSTVITDFFNDMTKIVSDQLGGNIVAITNVIAPFMGAAVMLYFVYVAYSLLYKNDGDLVIMEVVKNIAALSIVTAFTFSGSYYINDVVPFVMNAGDEISQAVAGGQNAASSLDSLLDAISTRVINIYDGLNFNPFSSAFGLAVSGTVSVIIILLGAIPFIFLAAAYLIVAKFMVGLLLSVGAIFICFAFFPATRSMFTSWTGQCLNYILMSVFYSITFKILVGFINDHMMPGGLLSLNWSVTLQMLVVFMISIYLIGQIPVLSSSLTGGVGINGLVGSMASTMGFVKKVGGSVIPPKRTPKTPSSNNNPRGNTIKGG